MSDTPFVDRLSEAPDEVRPSSPSDANEYDGAWDPDVPPVDSNADYNGAADPNDDRGVSLSDFYAYMPTHQYMFTPSRQFWPAASVNARIPPVALLDQRGRPIMDGDKPKKVSAAAWLDREKPVEQMTWSPGDPMVVRDRLVSEGGWIQRPGCSCFNLYLPPNVAPGDSSRATRWIEHVERVYPSDATHIIRWLAHRVQRPHEKINHALVLGGLQGIGKDTLLEPAKYAVGPWNFAEVSPANMLGRFNGFLKSVIMRVSEARDLGDVDRFAFYDHMKAYTAAPPDVLRVDEKHIREYAVFNVVGVIITSNHKSNGIYLPADDRRHYVAWSDLNKESFEPGYWNDLWRWYREGGGLRHVAAYLASLDLANFDAKAPPPKTDAFWAIVTANQAPEDAELADVLERLGNPAVTTMGEVAFEAPDEFRGWLLHRGNRRQVPHRFEECGYVPVRNGSATDGLWKVGAKRMAIYARKEMALREQLAAAQRLAAIGGQRRSQ